MNEYSILLLPVYGRLSSKTIWDKSGPRPCVLELDYVFDYLPKSPLSETFPIFMASVELAKTLLSRGFSGIRVAEARVTVSEAFTKLNPGKSHPINYRWLRVSGLALTDDFAETEDSRLIVSKRALEHLEAHGLVDFLKYDALKAPSREQAEKDIFDFARKIIEP